MRSLEKWDIWMSRKKGAFATGRSILAVCENCCIVPDTANRQIAHFLLVVREIGINSQSPVDLFGEH